MYDSIRCIESLSAIKAQNVFTDSSIKYRITIFLL